MHMLAVLQLFGEASQQVLEYDLGRRVGCGLFGVVLTQMQIVTVLERPPALERVHTLLTEILCNHLQGLKRCVFRVELLQLLLVDLLLLSERQSSRLR